MKVRQVLLDHIAHFYIFIRLTCSAYVFRLIGFASV